MISKIKNNKIIKITYGMFKWTLNIILVMALLVILTQRFSNNNVSIFGIRMFVIVSGSMEPVYNIGDILIAKETPSKDINVGDDVVYLGSNKDFKNMIITHRVIEKNEENGKYIFRTKGVNNQFEDPKIDSSQIYGKILYRTVFLSYISKLLMDTTSYFIISIIVGLMVSIQVVKIIYEAKAEDGEEE